MRSFTKCNVFSSTGLFLIIGLCIPFLLRADSAVSSLADDGLPFYCPQEHVYIHCGELHDNLDYYGYPKPKHGYGHFTVHGPYVHKHLDKCGIGYIKRKWKIKYHYDWYWCEQTIHIKEPYGGSFDIKNVKWPHDYHMKSCEGTTHPDHMPKGYGWPDFHHYGCAKLGLRYEDKVHPYGYGSHGYGGSHYGYGHACKVIYRTWELIDWCQYDEHHYGYKSSHYNTKGRWEYVQKIYVYDHEKPVIKSCPDDVKIVNASCEGSKTYVKIPKLEAWDNCGDVIVYYHKKHLGEYWSHTTDYSSGIKYKGSDASGYYKPGRTVVTFTAYDICGNHTSCHFYVDVKAEDKVHPTPIALSSITATLMQTGENEGMIVIPPKAFNISSYDNCSGDYNLKFSLSQDTFTCEDYGSNTVEFWVEDEAGNKDFVTVEVIIQSADFDCIGGLITGSLVSSGSGEGIDNAEVSIMDGMRKMTNAEGSYLFDDVPLGRDLSISAYKNDDPTYQGRVDMFDFALLAMHVDGIKEITEPRSLIAADIDGNQVIDYHDLISLQRVILGIDESFPNNTSWKFLKPGFVFPDTISPLELDLTSYYEVEEYVGADMEVNFEGIKIGDIGSLIPVSQKPDADAIPPAEEWLVTENQFVEAGQVTKIPITFRENVSANTAQLSLNIDTDKLEIIQVLGGELSNKGSMDVMARTEDGQILATWFSFSERPFYSDEVLFELEVRAKQNVSLNTAIEITDGKSSSKISSASKGTQPLELEFVKSNREVSFELYQNSPNPFMDHTRVGFFLPEAGEASLTFQDANGKQIHQVTALYPEGYNEVEILSQDLNHQGLLFYHLKTRGKQITKKMMVIR